jgi:hypothetical protein
MAGCGPTVTSLEPTAAEVAGATVVSCVNIGLAECHFVAERIATSLPEGRRAPFSIQVRLVGCANDGPCPRTLAARAGTAVIEYANGGQAIDLHLQGPPGDPRMERFENPRTEPVQPSSLRVNGPGPFEFEVGHCGLGHSVDFDGSFWVLSGQVNERAQAVFNPERGVINLVDRNVAEYRGTDDAPIRLARFPGAKRLFLCD